MNYKMLRWSTAAACLLLGGVRGAVVAASAEEVGGRVFEFDSKLQFTYQQARKSEGERRSLKMTPKDGTMLFDFTDPAIFGEEQAASWWESSDTVR